MNSFDLSIFNVLHVLAGRWFLLDWLAILIAVYLAYAMAVFFVLFAMSERDRKKRAYALAWGALAVIISRGIITEVIRFFYERSRPFVELGIEPVFSHAVTGSFPSGNMTFYAALIAPVWYLNRKWGVLYVVAVGLMGIARIYGAVHWPTDIIGGIVIGLGVSYGVKYALFGKTEKKQNAEAEEQI